MNGVAAISIINRDWQSDQEQNITFISCDMLREVAGRIIPNDGFDYIESGSGFTTPEESVFIQKI